MVSCKAWTQRHRLTYLSIMLFKEKSSILMHQSLVGQLQPGDRGASARISQVWGRDINLYQTKGDIPNSQRSTISSEARWAPQRRSWRVWVPHRSSLQFRMLDKPPGQTPSKTVTHQLIPWPGKVNKLKNIMSLSLTLSQRRIEWIQRNLGRGLELA